MRPGGAPHGGPATGGEQLVNGEAVEVDIRHARVASRGLALMIDTAVQAAAGFVMFLLVGAITTETFGGFVDEALITALSTFAMVAVFVAYPTAVETLTNGRSLGKRTLGLRVVREDGGPIRVRHALTRSLVGLAVEWPGLLLPPLTWAVALTTMLSSGRGRRLGDLAAGTYVVHERTSVPWGWVPAMPPAMAAWAKTLDLTRLDDDLALAVRHYLARMQDLREPMRGRLATELADEVAARIGRPGALNVPPWIFLSAVLAERRRRAGAGMQTTRALTQRIWPGFGRVEGRDPAPAWDPAVAHPPLLGIALEQQHRQP